MKRYINYLDNYIIKYKLFNEINETSAVLLVRERNKIFLIITNLQKI